MIFPKCAWKRKIGEPLSLPGVTKIIDDEGGLPNLDDGYFQGMPLGGIGAGTLAQTFRGDFSVWHLDVGKHIYENMYPCQFGIFEEGKAFILNDSKPKDGTLSSWVWQKQNGTYHALYPRAYFEYVDLNITCEQFSPIIPHNYKETSYPVAVFNWHISNSTNKVRELSILWSFKSIFGSSENVFYEGKNCSGLIFNNLNHKAVNHHGQMGIFIQKKDIDISFLNAFDPDDNGNDVWDTFSTSGTLSGAISNIENAPGALSAKIKVKPGENKKVTFVLAWDFPIIEFKTKWYKRYTKYFGVEGNNVAKIAEEAFRNNEQWLAEVKHWQEGYLKINKPDWFKTMLINELYYLAHGGTAWTHGKVLKGSKVQEEEHFGILECFDYPFYETLDVRFYGSFPLLKLWPDLEKLVLKDYIKSISIEDKEEIFFDHPLIQKNSARKLKGAIPHDLGKPLEDPFVKINSYKHVDINKWKDLNSKFVLLLYRYFYLTGKKDIEFLKSAWTSIVQALNYLKQFDKDNDFLLENENIPDQTYDNWVMNGPSTYCNGLWLAALKAGVLIAKLIDEDTEPFNTWLEKGKLSLESKLWNGEYYLFDTSSESKNSIMGDGLCGQWYGDLLKLGDIFQSGRTHKTLKKIFEFNVMKIKNGDIGAINGINPDGSLLPESKAWRLNTQSNEIWTGVTLALASFMEKRGLAKEAIKTVSGVYSTVYEKKGYWFRTPEAWDVNGNFRASMYHRPGSIWAFTFHDIET